MVPRQKGLTRRPDALPAYFREQLEPALQALLARAALAGEVRADIDAYELLRAVGNLSVPDREVAAGHTQRMVALLIDGLRYGVPGPRRAPKGKRRSR
jgi:hypothetical protein